MEYSLWTKANDYFNRGSLQEARNIFQSIIDRGNPDHLVFGRLAAICGIQGKIEDVIEYAEKAISLNQQYSEGYNYLGNAYRAQGDHHKALKTYIKAIELNEDYADAYSNMGNALLELGFLEEAIEAFHEAIQLDSNHADAYCCLGNAYKKKGMIDEACSCYRKSLKINRDHGQSHYNLGLILESAGEYNLAIEHYNDALKSLPGEADVKYTLANSLRKVGNLPLAIEFYKLAIEQSPNNASFHNNLGTALQEIGKTEEALKKYQDSSNLDPFYADPKCNIGLAYQLKGRLDLAEFYFRQAIELKPDHADSNANLACLSFLNDKYDEGWRQYQYRLLQKKGCIHALPNCPQWQGEDVPESTRLLIISEQGLGDNIQFLRYTSLLKRKYPSLSVCVPKKLHNLVRNSGLVPDPLAPEDIPKQVFEMWAPLLSVPGYLGVTPSTPILVAPYIKAKKDLVQKWADIFKNEKRPLVGINWQGNPQQETTTSFGRSFTIELFFALAQENSLSFISLQKGYGSEQLNNCSFIEKFVTCQDHVTNTWDFEDNAAIIDNCDLVITSDTSVAHLAGALGKTTWLLLKAIPDWRWGLEGDTTFWYPSMRLFRQQQAGNWSFVGDQISRNFKLNF